jgi:hypothetical protein
MRGTRRVYPEASKKREDLGLTREGEERERKGD